MRRRRAFRWHLSLGVLLVVASVPRPATAQTASPGTVLVELDRGDVRVVPSPGAELRVRAWALGQGPDAGADDPGLVTVAESGDVVRISARSAHVGGVGLEIGLPAGAILEVRLHRGDITASELVATLDLETARGDVHLRDVGGSALVDVENGNITASFRSLDPARPNAFSTLNGNLDLTVPRDASFDLQVRCRGCTLPDMNLPGELQRNRILAPAPGDPILMLEGKVNGGGPGLRVFTWNGEVRIAGR